MQVSLTQKSVTQIEADAIVVAVSSGKSAGEAIRGPAADIDQATGGAISRLFEHKEITGKANEVTPLM
ncbi:MAG: peptidase M17, partial [Euryarchaeota archaeon]|nr:peptidase M17 [Euryarchaeota archaeon]